MDNHSDSTSSTISARGVCSDLKSVAIAPVDRPTFTFIDHDDDLTTKRIKDVNARKAIRSHVMRDVRRRERLAGLKRVSRRDSRAQQPERAVISTYTNKDVVAGVDADADGDSSKAQKSIVMTTPPCCAPSQPQVTELDGAAKGNQRGRRPATFMAGCSPTPSSNPGPWLYPVPWLLDPFNTLPGATEAPSMIARLVFYCKLPGFLYGRCYP
ncbi:hypothetical protein PHISCL_00301 [Aspergillus sclerotialis]|uniref:Uncharacterized protein n=1 Tax=Aspergillus sclerotialis TaxID=2070753 RepID=A0A3A3ABQ8_9EURO|nr:hypothetical protein PHISCL_00301 [Aspergillus sclerotialis]